MSACERTDTTACHLPSCERKDSVASSQRQPKTRPQGPALIHGRIRYRPRPQRSLAMRKYFPCDSSMLVVVVVVVVVVDIFTLPFHQDVYLVYNLTLDPGI